MQVRLNAQERSFSRAPTSRGSARFRPEALKTAWSPMPVTRCSRAAPCATSASPSRSCWPAAARKRKTPSSWSMSATSRSRPSLRPGMRATCSRAGRARAATSRARSPPPTASSPARSPSRASWRRRSSRAARSPPPGQGQGTTFAQIAADELGAGLEDVTVRWGDTHEVAAGVGTFASRSVAMGGSAVVEACRKLRAATGGMSLREAAAAAGGLSAESRFESPLLFSSGAYAAAIEIERATGQLRIHRLVAADDPGTVVNPLLDDGQVLGAVAQGLGECLVEEAVFDEEGQPRTASFADYKLLTAAEIPSIETALLQTPSPHNPLGAKGLGEAGAIGTPAAIANAVADALAAQGLPGLDPPFTEERVWQALNEKEG